ncbi:MAG: hypothetical protein OHK0022_00890 [Roseiflexaceae bacterium]
MLAPSEAVFACGSKVLHDQFHWQVSRPLGGKPANGKEGKFHSAEGYAASVEHVTVPSPFGMTSAVAPARPKGPAAPRSGCHSSRGGTPGARSFLLYSTIQMLLGQGGMAAVYQGDNGKHKDK